MQMLLPPSGEAFGPIRMVPPLLPLPLQDSSDGGSSGSDSEVSHLRERFPVKISVY